MPKAFLDCVKNGGKVRTISLSDDKYVKICYLDGKTYRGHIHTKKEKK